MEKLQMFLALILLGVYASFDELKYGDGLGPREISWPKSWVNNLIELDHNHIESANNFYIYFNVDEQDLTGKKGYAYLTSTGDAITCTLAVLNEANKDYTASCVYNFETSVTYGPIHFVIRDSENGEIFAEDMAFGYLGAVSGANSNDGTLTVSFYSTTTDATYSVEQSVVLDFSFDTTDRLYPGDYFKIKLDEKFKYSTLTLSWTGTDSDKYFNTSVSLLQETVNTGSVASPSYDYYAYIYGLNTEVPSSTTVKFRLTGFTTASSATSANSYSWDLKIYRFGTNTLIKGYTGSGPDTAVNAGIITASEWVPNNSEITSTLIPANLVAYFRLKFTTSHAVPKGGKITVTFSSVVVNTKSYQSAQGQLTTSGTGAAYTPNVGSAKLTASVVDATNIDIAVTEADLPASSVVTLYNIVSVGSSASISISNIVSYTLTSSGSEIDKYDGKLAALTIAASSAATLLDSSKNSAFLATANGEASSTEVKKVYLKTAMGIAFKFYFPVDLVSADKFYIYHPFTVLSPATYQNSKVQTPSAFYTELKKEGSDTTFANSAVVSSNLPSASIDTTKVTVTLADAVTKDKYYWLFIAGGASGSPKEIYTPYFPTQQADLSEVVIKFTKSSIVYYLVNTFSIEGFTTSATFSLFCTNLNTAGNPATVSYTPAAYTPPANYGLSVYFKFYKASTLIDLRTLSLSDDGAQYPTSDMSSTVKYYLASSGTKLVKTESTLAASAKSFSTLLPATDGSSAYKVSIDIYVNNTSTMYLLSTIDSSTVTSASATAGDAGTSTSVAISTASPVKVVYDTTNGYINTGTTASETIAIDHLLIVPQGFSTTDSKIYDSSTAAGIASSNATFPYRVYYKTGYSVTEATTTEISLSVTSGWYTTDGASLTYAYAYSSGNTLSFGTACKKYAISQVVTGGPALTLQTSGYTPTTAKVQSYDYLTQTVTLKLTNTGAIYKNSILTIIIGDWTITSSVDNWVVKVDGTVVTGSLATKTWTGKILSDVATSKTIEVSVLCSSQTSTGTINGFTSAKIKLNDLVYLSWVRDSTNAQTTVSAATSVEVKASKSSLWVFPDVKGSSDVYLGLSFKPDYNIPSGSTIAITGFNSITNLKDSVWTSHSYSSVSQSSDTITITLSQSIPKETFKLVVDDAVDLTTTTPENVKVTVKGPDSSTTTLIDDSSITSLNQKYSVSTAPTNFTTSFTFTSNLLYAGFPSVYNFTISFNDTTAESFWVHFDASEDYNAIPGETFENPAYDEDWLYALNEKNEILRCLANHWLISCEINTQYTSDQKLSVLLYLDNPQAEGSFDYFLTDSEWDLLAAPVYATDSQSLTFSSSFSDSIDLYYADVSYTDDSHFYHDLTLSAFVKADAVEGGIFTVMFPMPYMVEMENSEELICSIDYINDQGSTVEVLADASCSVDDNEVYFTLTGAQSFASSNWTTFTVKGLRTPEASESSSRSEWIYEPSAWQGDYYSGKFCVSYGKNSETISAFSYDNLNAAFTAFTVDFDAWSSLVVNDGEDISVLAGTYTGPFVITSDDGEIDAESIKITWSESTESIEIEAESEYATYEDDYVFYVGTSGETPLGIYYIEWTIDETPFSGSDNQYVAPVKTKVYVSLDNPYDIYLSESEIIVVPNFGSFPIGAGFLSGEEDLEVWPYSDLTLTFSAVDEELGISFSPESIDLNGEWTIDYFTISCSGCTEDTTYEFIIELSGDAADAFQVEDSYSFTYKLIEGDAAVIELSNSEPESSGFTVSINSDYKGILTWCIVGENKNDNNLTEYESLLEIAYILGSGDDSLPTFESLVEDYYSEVEALLDDEEADYQSTVKSLLQAGADFFVYGQTIIEEGDNDLYTFDKLSPASKYTVYAYIDNLTGNIGKDSIEIETAAFPSHALLTISFDDDPESSTVISELIKFFKTKEKMVQSDSDRRMLADQVYTVYADPTNSVSPASADKAALGAAVGGTVEITEINADEYPVPEFDENSEFSESEESDYKLVLNFTATEDGTLYCLIVNGSGIESTTEEVYYGIDSEDRESRSSEQDVTADTLDAWVYDFNSTEADLDYSVYSVSCVLCNNFPGYVECGDEPIRTNFTYSEDGGSSSSGVILAAICAYFVL